MCTLSYLPEQAGQRWFFFNRDELRSRSRAEKPELYHAEGGDYLMSLDNDQGGSWMGLHSAAFFVCLLNNYPHTQTVDRPGKQNSVAEGPTLRKDKLRSRGLLIRDILNKGVFPSTELLKRQISEHHYSPFFLAALSLRHTKIWEWDGHILLPIQKIGLSDAHCPLSTTPELEDVPIQKNITLAPGNAEKAGMLTSSSFKHKQIVKQRMKVFMDLPRFDRKSLQRFHRSRGSKRPEEGIYMERPDACTVSISEICLVKNCGNIYYYADQPFTEPDCKTLKFTS